MHMYINKFENKDTEHNKKDKINKTKFRKCFL